MYLTFALYLMMYSYSNGKVRVAVCFCYLWEISVSGHVASPPPPPPPSSSRVCNHACVRAAEWKGFIVLCWILWMSVEQWGGPALQKDREAFYQSALGQMNFRWLYIWTSWPIRLFTSVLKDNMKSKFLINVLAPWSYCAWFIGERSWCNRCCICGKNYIKIKLKWHMQPIWLFLSFFFKYVEYMDRIGRLIQDLIGLWKVVFTLNIISLREPPL